LSFEEKILAGVIVGLLVPLMIYLVKRFIDSFLYESSKVKIDFTNSPPNKNLRVYVRHVRDGKDDVDGRSKIINKDIKVKFSKNGNGIAKVKHHKTLGFQFKCYIDIGSEPENKFLNMLGNNGISEWSYDESSNKRIWLLLPNEARCITTDNYENNYYHANRPKA
jgi:hypothetical protein